MVIAFIGLGEVGGNVSAGLAEKGVKVKGYDIRFETLGKEHFDKCSKAGVVLVDSPKELIEGSDVIISVTACSLALETAKMYKEYLTKGQVYCEFNSTTPDEVKEVEEYIGDACTFIDGCVLVSANLYKEKSPCCSSGPDAEAITNELNALGMNIKYMGDKIGQASAFKVIRSIFTKPFETALIECLTCARLYCIEQQVFDSFIALFTDVPLEDTLKMMVKTNVVHAKRRGDEIEAVTLMQEKIGLDNRMSVASTEKMRWLTNLGLNAKFGNKPAPTMNDVLDAILEAQGKK